MPTRGRSNGPLQRSIKSIIESASSKDNFEIIFGVDSDDSETLDYIKTLDKNEMNFQTVISEPLGYKSLYLLQNKMAEISLGSQLWTFSDDVEVLTQDWDIELMNNKEHLYLNVSLGQNFDHWPYSLIPVISKKWFEITGRISGNSQTDCWLGCIACDLQIIKKVSVTCNLFIPSDGTKHDTENLSTLLRPEHFKDKKKISEYTKTEDLGIHIPN